MRPAGLTERLTSELGAGLGAGLGTAAILTVVMAVAVRAPQALSDTTRPGNRSCQCFGALTGDCAACSSPPGRPNGSAAPKLPGSCVKVHDTCERNQCAYSLGCAWRPALAPPPPPRGCHPPSFPITKSTYRNNWVTPPVRGHAQVRSGIDDGCTLEGPLGA